MCDKIVINNGEVEIETPQDFVNYFHKEPIKDDMYSSVVMDACLCQINIEESLSQLNLSYQWDGTDYYVTMIDTGNRLEIGR